ncbi:MAG: hypothetical protein RMJ37_00375 [Spirochaetia bacterium]|nr:hypothetical protein [Spirochaetota bacterium]MCX8096850.1 hypothetical protein [Spirochaetota bacterium]MDW8111784.1 hypothetical protein [Spirochaetia bacterium]
MKLAFKVILFLLVINIYSYANIEFFYEEISIRNFKETNYTRTYIKGNMFRTDRTQNNSIIIYNIDKSEAIVIDTKNREYRVLPIRKWLDELSGRINGFIRFAKTFVGEIKISYSGEFTNVNGFRCVRLVDNFGGYYLITLDLMRIKTNFDSSLLRSAGYEYNYENFSRLFALKELTLDEKSKEYFFKGYVVEQLGVIKTVLFTETNINYIRRFSFEVSDDIFSFDLKGYRYIQ